MKGIVRAVNLRRGMAVIEAPPELGEYTVAELLGDELEADEEVTGNLHSLGGETLTTATGTSVRVFIEDFGCTFARACKLAGIGPQ